ncbi:MAG: dinitrogenase iron-molybdenum cofactor biosynthesis protein [Spirochaetia bacterium]|jgi:predicted Fe-Mo cluster-binding NifX family protein|nr:dinitrogenase iron-molybdenum cofactor biosynthesis protein [Spirochaetia bacterium]
MIIATTYENGQIGQHFGHTEEFKFYTVEDKKIVSSKVIPTGEFSHGTLPTFIKQNGATLLICGGLGGGARTALAEAGIDLIPGAAGDADQVVKSYLAGNLEYDPDIQCAGHEHNGSDHECGQDHQGCGGSH